MTPQQIKELAECVHVARKLLGADESGVVSVGQYSEHRYIELREYTLFSELSVSAPILAHLAKRKMEEMGFNYAMSISRCYPEEEKIFNFVFVSEKEKDCFNRIADPEDYVGPYSNNEYIALWLAIREAVKGG